MQLNHPYRATTRDYWEQYCKAFNIAVAKDTAMRKEAMETKWIQMAGKPNKDFLAKLKGARKRIGNTRRAEEGSMGAISEILDRVITLLRRPLVHVHIDQIPLGRQLSVDLSDLQKVWRKKVETPEDIAEVLKEFFDCSVDFVSEILRESVKLQEILPSFFWGPRAYKPGRCSWISNWRFFILRILKMQSRCARLFTNVPRSFILISVDNNRSFYEALHVDNEKNILTPQVKDITFHPHQLHTPRPPVYISITNRFYRGFGYLYGSKDSEEYVTVSNFIREFTTESEMSGM
jgi:hypothetical protein